VAARTVTAVTRDGVAVTALPGTAGKVAVIACIGQWQRSCLPASSEESMHKTMPLVAALAALALGLSAGLAGAADIQIGVNIAVPTPPVVLAPPPLVIVPGTVVRQVPSASFNLFVYRNRYYSFHNDAWFVATGPRAPWTIVAVESVPAAVRAVPVKHYKIPPGQAKNSFASGSSAASRLAAAPTA
jgi:hypothetical protein